MPLSLLNPWVILGLLATLLLSNAATGTLLYMRGRDDMIAAYTKQELGKANATIRDMKAKDAKAAKAGEDHDRHQGAARKATRQIADSVDIPPVADPYLPVGFVRMFDRAASRNIGADPYPGKSDGDPSDVRVSEAASLLNYNFGEVCEANRVQLTDLIDYLKADRAPEKKPSWLQSALDAVDPF